MCAKRKLRSSILFWPPQPSYTPYGCRESTSTAIAPALPHQYTSMAIATQPCLSIVSQRIIRRLYMCAKRKLRSSELLGRWGPSYTPYGGGESTSTAIPPTSTYQDTSMAIATQPCLSIVSQRIIRRLYMCGKRKLRSSELLDRWGPSYTPYGGGESTSTAISPLRLIRTPPRQ